MNIQDFSKGLDALIERAETINAKNCELLGVDSDELTKQIDEPESGEDKSEEQSVDDVEPSTEENGEEMQSNGEETTGESVLQEGAGSAALQGVWNILSKGGKSALDTAAKGGKWAFDTAKNGMGAAIKTMEKNPKTTKTFANAGAATTVGLGGVYVGNEWLNAIPEREREKVRELLKDEKVRTELDAYVNAHTDKPTDQVVHDFLKMRGFDIDKGVFERLTGSKFDWKTGLAIGGIALAAPLVIHYGKKLIDKITGDEDEKPKRSARRRRVESIEESDDEDCIEVDMPEWAAYYLEYDDPSGLDDADVKMVKDYVESMKKEGYSLQTIEWDDRNEFCSHPEFGKGCSTVKACFRKKDVNEDAAHAAPVAAPNVSTGGRQMELAIPAVPEFNSTIYGHKSPSAADINNVAMKGKLGTAAADILAPTTQQQASHTYQQPTGQPTGQTHEKGWLDSAKDTLSQGYGKLKDFAKANPKTALGLAAGAGALGTAMLMSGRRRRRNEATFTPSTAKVLVGTGNPLGQSIEPVQTNEGLFQIAGQIVGGAIGGTLAGGAGADLGGRIASGAAMTLGSMGGGAAGKAIDDMTDGETDEGTISDAWTGTKNYIKKNAKLIFPVVGTIGGALAGAGKMNGAGVLVGSSLGGLAGTLAAQAVESKKPNPMGGFSDFQSWRKRKAVEEAEASKGDGRKDIWTLELGRQTSSDGDVDGIDDMKYSKTYESEGDAIEDAVKAHVEYAKNGDDIFVSVLAGEYQLPSGDIYGEPYVAFEVRDGRLFDMTGRDVTDEYGVIGGTEDK